MSQPDQWRFQWPDGTWIRWNPQTQSWEKEGPGEEGAVDVLEPEPAQQGVRAPAVEEEAVPPESVSPEPAAGTRRRAMVGDVLPPAAEPESPIGSLWPTVVTGIAVGLAVGILLWQMIR